MENNPQKIESLVTAFKNGDQDAFSDIYSLTYTKIRNSIRYVVKDEERAEELTQDTFMKVFTEIGTLENPAAFNKWSMTIANRIAINYLNKKATGEVLFSSLTDEETDESTFEERIEDTYFPSPEEAVEENERRRIIREVLDSLKDDQRVVILMYYYQELKIGEIAKELQISENTVKTRKRTAENKIEEKVKELEKKGVRLLGLSPIAFFTWLLSVDAKAAAATVIPAAVSAIALETAGIGGGVTAAGAAASIGTAAGAASSGAAALGTAAGLSVGSKILLAVASVFLVTGAALFIKAERMASTVPTAEVTETETSTESTEIILSADAEETVSSSEETVEEVSKEKPEAASMETLLKEKADKEKISRKRDDQKTDRRNVYASKEGVTESETEETLEETAEAETAEMTMVAERAAEETTASAETSSAPAETSSEETPTEVPVTEPPATEAPTEIPTEAPTTEAAPVQDPYVYTNSCFTFEVPPAWRGIVTVTQTGEASYEVSYAGIKIAEIYKQYQDRNMEHLEGYNAGQIFSADYTDSVSFYGLNFGHMVEDASFCGQNWCPELLHTDVMRTLLFLQTGQNLDPELYYDTFVATRYENGVVIPGNQPLTDMVQNYMMMISQTYVHK